MKCARMVEFMATGSENMANTLRELVGMDKQLGCRVLGSWGVQGYRIQVSRA